MQHAIPCLFMRGGTSRGPFFKGDDLPDDTAARDRIFLDIVGSPDPRQIDGLGGAHPLTSKVGIVSRSAKPGIDLEFLFAQLQPTSDKVDTTPNCGNMLAAVVPFALETGLIAAQGSSTTARVLTLNTGMACDVTVDTPHGYPEYEGTARIDGVPGTASPVRINFLDTAGSVCAALLPTGRIRDRVEIGKGRALVVTCIDNGMPMVLVHAQAVGRLGDEAAEALNQDIELKAVLEALRLRCGELMGLGDVAAKNYPKMCLVSPPQAGGAISTRCFIPHVCHDAIGVLAAVTVATACVLEGSVAHELTQLNEGPVKQISIEHPSGEFSVELELDPSDLRVVRRAALLRTARLIMRGEVMVKAQALNNGSGQ